MPSHKFLDYDTLINLNNKAIKLNLNRILYMDEVNKVIDQSQKYPVIRSVIHNDHEMRCEIVVGVNDKNPIKVWLDMNKEDYHGLPVIELN